MRRNATMAMAAAVLMAACGDGPSALPDLSVHAMAVGPAGPVDLVVGDTVNFTAFPKAKDGTILGSAGVEWSIDDDQVASLTVKPGGYHVVLTGLAPGTARIEATSEGKTATVDVAVVQGLAVHTWSLADGVAGEAYAAQLQATGGRGTYTWSLTGGLAEAWMALSSEGTLSGTPTASGSSSVTVAVSDESGQQSTRQLAILVLDPVAVAAMSLPPATQGRDYAAQLVATGGSGAYSWALDSGALPTGVGLASGGALTGAPADAGAFTFTARVTDGAGREATRSFSLTVEPAPTIQTASLPPGDVGAPYSAQLAATGGTGTYSWSVTDGALPAGLTLSAAGVVSGTPTTLGSTTFTVRVTDEASVSDTRTLTVVVAEIAELVSGTPVSGIGGAAGSVRHYGIEVPAGATQLTVAVSGGTGDVDLYVRHGALPAEFAYDCRPLREGNQETCTFTSPSVGHWYIMLRGYGAYAGVTLVATHNH